MCCVRSELRPTPAGGARHANCCDSREPQEQQPASLIHGHRHQPAEHAADHVLRSQCDEVRGGSVRAGAAACSADSAATLPLPVCVDRRRSVQVGVTWQKAVKNAWKVSGVR